MEAGEYSPQQVSYHCTVLILTPTVVSMEVYLLLTQPMYFKEVMQHADDGVGTFTTVNCLINEVNDLAWKTFAAYTQDATLPWDKEVHGARLLGVVWACWAMSNE